MALWNDPYTRPLLRAIGLQIVLLFITGLGDPPELFLGALGVSSLGFWVITIVIFVRRPQSPTEGDLIFIRWGLFAISVLASPVAIWYWVTFRGALG